MQQYNNATIQQYNSNKTNKLLTAALHKKYSFTYREKEPYIYKIYTISHISFELCTVIDIV